MRRKPSAADGRSVSPTELIARITAEHDSASTATGRHRTPGGASAVLLAERETTELDTTELPVMTVARDTDTIVGTRGALTRRLAPLAVGAAVMLVATTIATVVRPAEDVAAAPELSAAQLQADESTLNRLGPTSPSAAPSATATPATAAAATAVQAAAQAASERAVQEQTAAPNRSTQAAAPRPTLTSGGDGKQAAAANGWQLTGGDEFNGGLSDKWGVYEGAGHDGNGRRTAEAISVENGVLVIRGDADGNTGGMAWDDNQRFGKWEMRARFPAGDDQYHPVLLLWPNGPWPEGGEVDFAETTSASDKVSFFLHYSASNQQEYAHKNIDLTQWHNYAVEWVDGRITGFIDGEQWFESTDGKTMPPGEMHAAIQLDYFQAGGSPRPTEIQVDYMRIYE